MLRMMSRWLTIAVEAPIYVVVVDYVGLYIYLLMAWWWHVCSFMLCIATGNLMGLHITAKVPPTSPNRKQTFFEFGRETWLKIKVKNIIPIGAKFLARLRRDGPVRAVCSCMTTESVLITNAFALYSRLPQ